MTAKKNILLLLLLLTVLAIKGKAQSYGNEWINYGQKYYSFNVYTTGVHKLDYATLSAAGIDLDGLNSDYFQIFGREREIPLYIEDGMMDGSIPRYTILRMISATPNTVCTTILFSISLPGIPLPVI